MDTPATHGGKRPGAGRKKGPVSSAAQDFAIHRAEKEKHLATLRRLEAEEREGNLMPVDTLRDVMASVATQIGAIMDAIPVRLKREAPHLTATDIEIVKREIAAAMNAASRVRYNP
jgi:phage terminase Nu1 subunit (DNA packaging protein)